MGKLYNEYVKKLEKLGYTCTHYSDINPSTGLAYYETKTNVLKIIYEWVKIADNHYTSGKILSVENVSECYL